MIGVASLILGMGVPVTAAYLIVAVLAVPALTDLGVALIAAHMIVYWFSQDSNITPPVCVAAYAGAAIAGADPWKTGWTSFKFAKLLYVMPLLFAYPHDDRSHRWDTRACRWWTCSGLVGAISAARARWAPSPFPQRPCSICCARPL
ncbi:MAG: TRAP transporter large permease subunit [Caldilineaceae bacterium]